MPPGFRKRAPSDVALHRAELGTEDVRRDELLAYTTPARTVLDLLAVGFPVEPLRQAYREAVDRGLMRRGALDRAESRVRAYLNGVPRARAVDLRDRSTRLMDGA